jgi:hypothetical protein
MALTWFDRALAWFPAAPEKEYDLNQLFLDAREKPSLLVSEVLHATTLLLVSTFIYPRVAPAW